MHVCGAVGGDVAHVGQEGGIMSRHGAVSGGTCLCNHAA